MSGRRHEAGQWGAKAIFHCFSLRVTTKTGRMGVRLGDVFIVELGPEPVLPA
jgi:hypothetical protein